VPTSEQIAEVNRRVEGYRPVEGRPREVYEQAGDQIRQAVAASDPSTVSVALSALSALVYYVIHLLDHALWSPESDQPLPVTYRLVQHFVHASAHKGLHGDPATIQSRLTRVGRAWQPESWPPEPPRNHKPPSQKPFSHGEQLLLLDAGYDHLHATGDPVVLAYVTSGLGAGLTAADYRHATGLHVVRHDDGLVTVTVEGSEGRDRTVPVVDFWAGHLVHAAELVGDQLLVGGYDRKRRNLTAYINNRVRGRGLPSLSSHRMRNTWLVERLDAGVPLPVIVAAGGLTSGSSLTRLMPHLASPPEAEQVALLRQAVRR
jgi:integrase